ncbi:MAG TPA: zinc dependent phospholipase C family protein [Chitinophagaceae bacterium]|nr:zinc dependent phospholipase C family protein [Chitinophagaceae bacterium]
MKSLLILVLLLLTWEQTFCWGFYAHKKINYHAVFLLPPAMMVFYKPQINYISEHAVDPDKRRYAIKEEGPRHYIDLDFYGPYPYDSLPRKWNEAVVKYGEETLQDHGILPWWLSTMLYRLTEAFKEKNSSKILKLSAEIGHYIADAHVPLHASSNHNGQLTSQHGIHGFWESRVPEMLAEKEWDFFIGKAEYLKDPSQFMWTRILESAAAADTVLKIEKQLSINFPSDLRYSFENRNGVLVKQYSSAYTMAYDKNLKGMVERRMRQSIYAVASFWYTAWVNAGQPDLLGLTSSGFTKEEENEFEVVNNAWRNKPANLDSVNGQSRSHEDD